MKAPSEPKPPEPDTPRQRSLGERLLSRSTILIALSALLVISAVIWGSRIYKEMRYADQSARAMAACHHTPQGEAFKMEGVSRLADAMAKLSFSPVLSQRVATLQPEFIDAYYCDILGRTAVHIRLTDAEGIKYSLFQAPLASTDPKLRDSELIGEGVMVRLWRQDGLLMGLVGIK